MTFAYSGPPRSVTHTWHSNVFTSCRWRTHLQKVTGSFFSSSTSWQMEQMSSAPMAFCFTHPSPSVRAHWWLAGFGGDGRRSTPRSRSSISPSTRPSCRASSENAPKCENSAATGEGHRRKGLCVLKSEPFLSSVVGQTDCGEGSHSPLPRFCSPSRAKRPERTDV